jgi:threonine dehydrogenase-like Zn-dependent dehydrogenase
MTVATVANPAVTSASPEARVSKATTMRAAVIRAPRSVEIRTVAIPLPRGNELRVRLEGCGVCASNIPPWEGREWFRYPMMPGQLGHEAWGAVDSVGGDVSQFHVGERVAILSEHAYAEYDVAREDQTVLLPDVLAGQPFPAEPLGCAMNILARCGNIRAGQTVAIIGIGFLGAILTRLISNANARVIAISRRPYSLEVARQMGAAQTIPMEDHAGIIDRVRQLTGGQFCEVVIEAVGKQWPLDLAGELTRERGRLVVAGYHQDGLRQCNLQLWNWRGIDVINAHERDPLVYLAGMKAAVKAVAGGQLDPAPLFTHRFKLEQLGEAMEMTRERADGFLKALIVM